MILCADLVDAPMVVCAEAALNFAGLVIFNSEHLIFQTCEKELGSRSFGYYSLYYNHNIDYRYKIRPFKDNPNLLLPTKERALVECILHLDWVDEGLLIEALKDYMERHWNEKEFYEVADHFGLDRETLEYWLKEARNDYDE